MPYRDCKSWRASVVLNGKRLTSLKNTKKEAITWEVKKKEELKIAGKLKSEMNCLNLCSKYLDFSYRYSKATLNDKKSVSKRFLQYIGPDTLVSDIGPSQILEYLNIQARNRSNNASNSERKNLMAMFNYSIKFHGLTENPVIKVDKLPHDRKPQYTPSQENILRLLAVANREEKVFLLSYLNTAARRSEIFRWKWSDDINFEKKEVRLGTRKTKDGSMEYEWLPMSDELCVELLWWLKNHPIRDNQHVFYVADKNCMYYGQPFTTRRKFMSGLCKRADIKPFGFHALRRYVASVLADTHKVSAKTIQRILRHKNITTTERYIQNINNDLGAIMNLLSNGGVVKIHESHTRKTKIG